MFQSLPRRRRWSAKRNRKTLRLSSVNRLAFERLENRCLLSSGFDTGVLSANLLRSPLRDADPARAIAIRRFLPTGLVATGDAAEAASETIRVTYTPETLQLPWEHTEREQIRLGRPNSTMEPRRMPETRPGSIAARPLPPNEADETNPERRQSRLEAQGPADEKTDRELAKLDRERVEPVSENEKAPTRPPRVTAAHYHAEMTDGMPWSEQRFQHQRRLEAANRESAKNAENEQSSSAEQAASELPGSEIIAYHIAVGSEVVRAESAIDLEALAAMMTAESDSDPPKTTFSFDNAFTDSGVNLLEVDTLDFTFAALAKETSGSVGALASVPLHPPQNSTTEVVSTEEKAVSMAAAAAVLAATRVESRRATVRGSRKSGWPAWIGAAAQFMLTPRFTTPRQPTVMLALSDESVREELHRALAAEGYAVREAGTLREAVCHVQASWEVIDVAVVDTELDDYPGIYLCNKIREKYPKLPVVVCSDDATHPDLSQFRRLGARRCLMKPITTSELLATINTLVS